MATKQIGQIDLNQVDKNRIVVNKDKNGKEYKNLPIEIIIFDKENEYGNRGMIKIAPTKEEREAAKANGTYTDTPILGNIKFVFDGDNEGGSQKQKVATVEDDDDLLPF